MKDSVRNLIEERESKLMRKHRVDAGGQACMIDDMPVEMMPDFFEQACNEIQKELFEEMRKHEIEKYQTEEYDDEHMYADQI